MEIGESSFSIELLRFNIFFLPKISKKNKSLIEKKTAADRIKVSEIRLRNENCQSLLRIAFLACGLNLIVCLLSSLMFKSSESSDKLKLLNIRVW